MQITSTAFGQAELIPERYTGEGGDVSPPLLWSDLPTGTLALALLCEDPDAPKLAGHDHPFVHWLVYNIPPGAGMLPEGVPQGWSLQDPIPCEQGQNSMGHPGYNGPFPPVGHGPHRYVFRLFALSRMIHLPRHPKREQFLQEIGGAILGEAQLVGVYERRAAKKTG